eukprot:TRINITY_DN7895_c0_g1_i13.p1 TRINITY_DN7895_c0_g1~~TRINITY_DN7895_c0_g1_i13.p1  ORF type:complete len:260 (-),score=40.28 TRINITY_DN7895_c0_g1_i13:302-1009(-)
MNYEQEENEGNCLYVASLNPLTREKDLRVAFEKFGKVAECSLKIDPKTEISRGFAFVTMSTPQEAEDVIRCMNGVKFDDRVIKVELNSPYVNPVTGTTLTKSVSTFIFTIIQYFHFLFLNHVFNGLSMNSSLCVRKFAFNVFICLPRNLSNNNNKPNLNQQQAKILSWIQKKPFFTGHLKELCSSNYQSQCECQVQTLLILPNPNTQFSCTIIREQRLGAVQINTQRNEQQRRNE